MTENGEEKLIAVARHIAKTLGHNESMADDILQIFSNFDGRFSRENLSEKLPHDDSDALTRSLKSLETQFSQYVASDNPIWSDSAASSAFLDYLDELISTLREWSPLAASDKVVAACMSRAEDLLQQAMFRLVEEFRLLMERGGEAFEFSPHKSVGNLSFDSDDEEIDDEDENYIPVAQPLSDYDIVIDALPSGTINDLHEIAKRMVAAGFSKECSHVYSACRRDFLEESASRLGLQKWSIEEVQNMTWHDLEDEIEKWIKAASVMLRILFPSERRLCDRVFFGLSSASDMSFMEVCRGSTIQILNFADAIAIGSRSPERLFKVMDLFETMRDLMPEFEINFSDQYCVVLRNGAFAIWKRLGEAIRATFMELENLIRRDPAKAAVPGGGLHPITRYVLNYLRAACRSRDTLEQVFAENVSGVHSKDSSLAVQMVWIMELLESNLEVKSKIYGDPALSCVFMMNNGRYIVQKVKDSDLGLLLGEDWIRKHAAKIKQFHSSYQRSWNKVLGVLRGGTVVNGGPPNYDAKYTSLKDKIKAFNSCFEDICNSQRQWVIFDEQLKRDVRISLNNLVLPAYRNFLARFQNAPEVGRHADKYIKYSMKDVGSEINGLFQGEGGGTGSAGGKKLK